MIGAWRGRVVAVVRRDDEEIALAQGRHESGKGVVDFREALRETGRVVPVAPLRIEIDEVREDETALPRARTDASSASPARLSGTWTEVIPRCANRSSIFPTPLRGIPALSIRSSSVGPGGSREKSLLRGVLTREPHSPEKGLAMTLATASGP